MEPLSLPIRSSLPAPVVSWLASVTRTTRNSDSGENLMPKLNSSSTAEGVDPRDLASAYRSLNEFLAPGSPEEITAEVMALLSHYFMPDLPAAVHSRVLEDWCEIFSTVPLWALQKARMEWLAEESRRPTPADIRAITIRLTWNDGIARRLVEKAVHAHPALAKPGAVVPA